MMFRVCLLAFGICFTATTVWAGSQNTATPKKPEVQIVCPVFTDRIVGPSSRFLRYKGIKVYFSSDLAARKWMRDPVSYLDKAILPQIGDLTLPERLTPQHYCPVFPKRKISMKDPWVIHEDQRVFLFDEEALKIWRSAPEKFVDPEILPQFAKEEPPVEKDAPPDANSPQSP